MRSPTSLFVASIAFAAVLAGCSAAPMSEGTSPSPPPAPHSMSSGIVSGAPDTAGSIPGSASALYTFRFKQTDPPSTLFNFKDRDLSFYFRPSPTALYFRVENLQGRSVQLDWDHSVFYDVDGRSSKPAHGNTRWDDRFSPMVYTLIAGQQQYGDYMFPLDYLVDPGATGLQQPHRPIVPEDASAPTFSGRSFGADLVFNVEDRPRTYAFRFQVVSVIPR